MEIAATRQAHCNLKARHPKLPMASMRTIHMNNKCKNPPPTMCTEQTLPLAHKPEFSSSYLGGYTDRASSPKSAIVQHTELKCLLTNLQHWPRPPCATSRSLVSSAQAEGPISPEQHSPRPRSDNAPTGKEVPDTEQAFAPFDHENPPHRDVPLCTIPRTATAQRLQDEASNPESRPSMGALCNTSSLPPSSRTDQPCATACAVVQLLMIVVFSGIFV